MSTINDLPPLNSTDQLLTDEEVAKLLNLSIAWVRKQRFLRRKNQPHVFDIDPVTIGGLPRYRPSEVHAWLNNL